MTEHRRYKDEAYAALARLGAALSAPKRVELLELLAQCPRTVEDLAAQGDLSVANASHHLRALHAARLVENRRRGLHVEYRLADEQVAVFLALLRRLAEARLDELPARRSRHFRELQAPPPMEEEEARALLDRGEARLLDVRPAEEFRAAHLPGALGIPLAELEARRGELPTGRTLLVYCRGPDCAMAAEAVGRLRARGWPAERVEWGVTEWRARGGTLATGEAAP